MPGKRLVGSLIMMMSLLAAPVVFADQYGEWSKSYSGVQYQYVKQFVGGNDWDGVRWRNNNSRKVSIEYKTKQQDGKTTVYLIYLNKNETSVISAIAAGQRVISVTVKAQ